MQEALDEAQLVATQQQVRAAELAAVSVHAGSCFSLWRTALCHAVPCCCCRSCCLCSCLLLFLLLLLLLLLIADVCFMRRRLRQSDTAVKLQKLLHERRRRLSGLHRHNGE